MALTRVKGSVKIDQPFLTVDEMKNARGIKVGDEVRTAEFSTGNGGGGVYDVVLESSVVVNGENIIQSVADPTLAFVLRTQDKILAEQWGIIGDNSTDNTAALTNLITYASTNDLGIKFGPGIFRVSTIDITGINDLKIEGQGENLTVLMGNASSSTDFVFGADGYDSGTPANSIFTRRLVMRDLSIQAINANQYNHCLKVHATTEWDFQNVSLGGNKYAVSTVPMQFCNNNRFEGGTMSNQRTETGNAFVVSMGTNNVNVNTFLNVRMTGAAPGTSSGTSVGVELKGNGNSFINCDISNFDYGCWPDGSKGATFLSSYFEKTDAAIINGENPVGGIVTGMAVIGGLVEVLTNGRGIVTANTTDSMFGVVIQGVHFNGESGGSNRTAIDLGTQTYTASCFGNNYTNIDTDITGTQNPGGGLGKRIVETIEFQADGTTKINNALEIDDDSTSGNTRVLVYDVDNGQLERVTVGAADSGGAGFKVLRIPN